MTKKDRLERLMELGATPEAISEYLNMDIEMVKWMISQIEKERGESEQKQKRNRNHQCDEW